MVSGIESPLAELQGAPPGVAEAGALIAQIDDLLRTGLGVGRGADLIARIGLVFEVAPLAAPLAERLAPLLRGDLRPANVLALAAARAALQGARYTALHSQAQRALGRTPRPAEPACAARRVEHPLAEVAQHWLTELAVGGLERLTAAAVEPFQPTLSRMRQEPALAELAFLLSGMVEELLAALPISRETIPIARWADLWGAALLQCAGAHPRPEPALVSARFAPLGIEQREGAHGVSLVAHGLLTTAEGVRPARIARTRHKVGAIRGATCWLLFPELAALAEALLQGRALLLSQATLSGEANLIWDAGRATLGGAHSLADTAAALAPGAEGALGSAPLPALQRHPIQIAEPLLLSGATIDGAQIHVGAGAALPLDPRWDQASLGAQALAEAAQIYGLLRFDAGRWAFQPLSAATRKGKLSLAGQAGMKLLQKPPKQHPVAILEERASRLLRR